VSPRDVSAGGHLDAPRAQGGAPGHRCCREEGQSRLGFPELELDLLNEASMNSEGQPLELRRVFAADEQRELKGFG
jgi:hypothetical protein